MLGVVGLVSLAFSDVVVLASSSWWRRVHCRSVSLCSRGVQWRCCAGVKFMLASCSLSFGVAVFSWRSVALLWSIFGLISGTATREPRVFGLSCQCSRLVLRLPAFSGWSLALPPLLCYLCRGGSVSLHCVLTEDSSCDVQLYFAAICHLVARHGVSLAAVAAPFAHGTDYSRVTTTTGLLYSAALQGGNSMSSKCDRPVCEHCDGEIRYFQSLIRMGGSLFHAACLSEIMDAVPAERMEDWELEARRHADALNGSTKAAYEYHIERRL